MIKYIVFISIILTGTIGQIFLKLGVNLINEKISFSSLKESTHSIIFFLQNRWIVSAILIYAIGAFAWLYILSKFELSYAFPIMSASIFALVLLASHFILNENITTLRTVGTIIIIIGITIVAIK
ncbi:hypothetical protein KAU09_01785 [Candidatus Parcubacteria bacterium]|nr:hypothetical protein [Candidatus Parcubacteria bacterium]